MAFTASKSKATPLGDPSTTPCILAHLKPHAIHTGRQLSSPLVGHYQHFIGIDLESQRELSQVHSLRFSEPSGLPRSPCQPAEATGIHAILPFISLSFPATSPPCHLQEHPERIQLGGLHHPPEAHPTVAVRSPALTFCSSTQGREFPRSILPLWPTPFWGDQSLSEPEWARGTFPALP